MLRRWSLAAQILLLQLVIVTLTVTVGALLTVDQSRRQLDESYAQRVLAIAESVAAIPAIREAFAAPDPSRIIQPIAETVREAAGATFVVVANRDQVRYSHPDPWKIGQRLSTDASPALDSGRAWVGTETGTLGRSVRAKVPVLDDRGEVIGVVSVGILEQEVAAALRDMLPQLLVYAALGLALGAAGSWLLARRVKRQTFGLEPREIAGLLEQREAMLHGIREGMLAVDSTGRITVVNDEARRLLDLPEDCVGRRVTELALPSRVTDVLTGRDRGEDQFVLRAGRVLVLNRMPVALRGEDLGAVVTLRDRTELESLLRELDGARTMTDALRAQAHEFANRMHTVGGLIALGAYDEALGFITRESDARERLAALLGDRVREPALAALLLAKAAFAAERGVELRVAAGSDVPPLPEDAADLVTVVGNLVDNAVEALPGGGWVEVGLTATPEQLPEQVQVVVRDSGPGVAPELAEEVFREGFTTKVARLGGGRGLGLALTRQACVRRGGRVAVHNEGGAVFTAVLPLAARPVGSGR